MAVESVSSLVLMDGMALSQAIKSKQVSCAEVMTAYLDHIEIFNPRVNAIISMPPREALLAEADERDAQLRRGQYLGWMHGFPHAVKDNIPVKGMPFTRGSPGDVRATGLHRRGRGPQVSHRTAVCEPAGAAGLATGAHADRPLQGSGQA